MNRPEIPPLLSSAEVCEALGVHRTTLWRGAKTGSLPKPLDLGGGLRRWRADEIADFVEAKSAERMLAASPVETL